MTSSAYKVLPALIGLLFLAGCGNDQKTNNPNTSPQPPICFLQPEKNVLVSGDSLIIKKNPVVAIQVDSLRLYWSNQYIKTIKGLNDFSFATSHLPLGIRELAIEMHSGGGTNIQSIQLKIVSDINPPTYSFQLLSELPHDTKAFTEGLEFDGDVLIESTGMNGTSEIKTINTKGESSVKVKLDNNYFGEGITKLHKYIYQLTWREKTGFVYDSAFNRVATFMIDNEGWGMSNDGTHILRSDGTSKIYVTDKNSFSTVRTIQVFDGKKEVEYLNELEYVNGFVYANIWQSDSIVKIDAATGKVVAYIDLSSLRKKVKNPEAEVLNGIAWHAQKKCWYVTGKYWDKIFAIKVVETPAKS